MFNRGDKVTVKIGRGTFNGRVTASNKETQKADVKLLDGKSAGKLIQRRWGVLTHATATPAPRDEAE